MSGRAYSKTRACAYCRACANYGHGCSRVISEAEFAAWSVEREVPPTCYERDQEPWDMSIRPRAGGRS